MSQPDVLDLWYEHRRVGTLWRNPVGLMGFRYHPEWLETGFVISRSSDRPSLLRQPAA